MALPCDLAIPLVVIVGVGLSLLIDPEMARGHADYARAYRGLDVARGSGLIATAALALLLWIACCSLVLASRQRSRGWLALAGRQRAHRAGRGRRAKDSRSFTW